MKLWQHEDTGNLTWNEKRPSRRWYEIPWMYEDELPEDLSNDIYDWWFKNSIIDGIRIGPKI